MDRRAFLQLMGLAMAARVGFSAESDEMIQTVNGPVSSTALGLTLSHEHVLVDFVGAELVGPHRYAIEDVLSAVRPHVERAYRLGVRAIFECTPAFLARDVRLLRRLSTETGVHFVTNTGLYGVRNNLFLPPYAHTETARQLADRWIQEARLGIDGSDIRPGFIKSGVDVTPVLSPQHRKLVEAAALTHLETGLTIAVHTGRGPGLEALDILKTVEVRPTAFVWVHAQNALDDALFAAADRGAWLSFDGINTPTLTRHLHLCREMKRRGHLRQVLISHDAGWFDPAKPGGGSFRPYDLLFSAFLPMLRADDFSEDEIRLLLVNNPARAFAVRSR